MTESLTTSATSAGNLLGSGRFLVPQFQREYAWGREEVKAFWTDLQAAVSTNEYFLGLLIFTREDGYRYVVDGQQRLITLSLLARAVERASLLNGRRALAERIQSNLLFAIDYQSDEVVPRVALTDRHDNQTFISLISGADVETDREADFDDDDVDDEEWTVSRKMVASYRYLSQRLSADLDDGDAFERLGNWAEFLLDRLYFAVFNHPDKSAAFKVFEVVNTRGKQLTTADLVKSYMLSKSDERKRDSRYERWTAIADAFRTSGYQSQFAQYLRHVITEHHGYVLPRDLYDFVSKNYVGDDGVELLLHRLTDQLPAYLQMMDPTAAGPFEGRSVRVLGAMDTLDLRSVRPMLLAISGTPEEELGMVELLKLVVRRVVVGNFGTGNVERKFSEAARMTFADPGRDWRVGLESLSDLNPAREDFQSRLAVRPYNKSVLFFLRSSIVQGTATPEIQGFLHFVRPRNAVDWSQFSDENFKVLGATIGNTVLAKLQRRPMGSNSPQGFRTLLLPSALPDELLTNGTFGNGSSEDLRRVGVDAARVGAEIWYE